MKKMCPIRMFDGSRRAEIVFASNLAITCFVNSGALSVKAASVFLRSKGMENVSLIWMALSRASHVCSKNQADTANIPTIASPLNLPAAAPSGLFSSVSQAPRA